MNNYEQKKEDKKQKYLQLAKNAGIKSNQYFQSGKNISSAIPFGQPILIGHHSEKRHRRDIDKINNYTKKSIEEENKKEYYENKAQAIENNNAISSDDPDAITKLKEKLSMLEKKQNAIKEFNKKAKINNTEKAPAYLLANNNQNMNAIKKRIASLEARKKDITKIVFENDKVKIIDNVEENRIQIVFPEKPNEEIIKLLKSHGFKFSYTNMAWQSFRNNNSIYITKHFIIKELQK